MTISSFHIRPATSDDVVLQLIIDLAIYEKEPDAVKATPELLRKNLFETPYARALVAVAGTTDNPGKHIGLALYFFNFSTWTGRPGLYLEDLYVSPECRNLGVGKALFGELGKIAKEKVNKARSPLPPFSESLDISLLNPRPDISAMTKMLTENNFLFLVF
ncbi:Peroxygenase 1 [Marasmius tenuissimus]|nr:Peroxygenase 1 [Marasmius tenuissimus]